MTITAVNSTNPRVEYVATAGQTVFDYDWPVFAETDLEVYLSTAGDQPVAADILTLNTDYTVAGEETNGGGTITLTSAATAGDRLVIRHVPTLQRVTNYTNGGPDRATDRNDEYNKVWMAIKRLEALKLDRSQEDSPTMDGDLSMAMFSITDVPDPTAGADAVNRDYVLGQIGSIGNLNVPTLSSIAQLRALTPTSYALVSGYYEPGDGGGGLFYYDSSDVATADNGGSVIVGDTGARWKRVPSVNSGFTAGQNLLGANAGPVRSSTTTTIYNYFTGVFVNEILLSTLSLEPGDVISFSGEKARVSLSSQVRFEVRFYNSGGSEVAPATVSDYANTSSLGTWFRDKIENITIPASAHAMRITATKESGGLSGSVRRAMLNRGPVALPFEEPPTRVNRGEVQEGADVTGDTLLSGLLPNWSLSIADSSGLPAGIQPIEGIADRSQLSFIDSSNLGMRILGAPEAAVAYGWPAIPIDDRAVYSVSIRHRSETTSAAGYYLRLNELAGPLPDGETHVSDRTSFVDLVNNGPVPGTAYITSTYTYTPTPGTDFASFLVYNWSEYSGWLDVKWISISIRASAALGADVTGDTPEGQQARNAGQNLLGSNAGPVQSSITTTIYNYFTGFVENETLLSTLSLEPGDVISFSGDKARVSLSSQVRFEVQFYNSIGSEVAPARVSDYANTPSPALAAWFRDKIENITIPASAHAMRITATKESGGLTGSVRRAMLNRGPVALPFEEPPTRVNRGEVQEGADVTGDTLLSGLLPNWSLSIADSSGLPAGIQPIEGIADRSQLSFIDSSNLGMRILGAPEAVVAYGWPAIPIDDRAVYSVSIRHRSETTSAAGYYLRLNELAGPLPDGETHVSDRTSFVDLVGNGPVPGTAYITSTYTYTPTPGTDFASFLVYNGSAYSNWLDVKWVLISIRASAALGADVTVNTPEGQQARNAGQNLLGSNAGPAQSSITTTIYNYFTGVFVNEILLSTLSLEPGDVISFSGDKARVSLSSQVRFEVRFYNSDGSEVAPARVSDYANTPSPALAAWFRDKIENITIPASAHAMRITATKESGGLTGSVRRAMLNRGPVALPFEEPPTRVNRGEVQEGADVTGDNLSLNVSIRPVTGISWSLVDGSVVPSQTTVDRDVEFTRNGIIATHTVRCTRDSSNNLAWSSVSSSGETTTFSAEGNGTKSCFCTVGHTASGEEIKLFGIYIEPGIGTPTK